MAPKVTNQRPVNVAGVMVCISADHAHGHFTPTLGNE